MQQALFVNHIPKVGIVNFAVNFQKGVEASENSYSYLEVMLD